MKRRNVIKGLTLLPVAGSVMLKESWALPATGNAAISAGSLKNAESITTEASFMAEGNIFRSIGVEPVINCMGTYTIIGGSIERPAVREAMHCHARWKCA